ncbi:MAG: hypothetical protein AAF726_11470 [Planctomycetota bacterium]
MFRHLSIAASIGVLLTLPAGASPQSCLTGDDGLFTGACCDFVSPNLPQFPAWDSDSQWLSIQNCSPEIRDPGEFGISEPVFVTCDTARYEAKFNVDFGGGRTVRWEGRLNGKYARTFGHVKSTNEVVQVWRFLLNGDFRIASINFVPNDAEIPPSVQLFGAVHFVGHIDYACNALGGYDVAVSLQHLPGCIAHGALSNRPAGGPLSHPDRNYYLIAPQSFQVAAGQGTEPQGRIVGDDMRFTTTPFDRCFSELRIRRTPIESIFRGCPCIGPVGSMPWITQETALASFCGFQTTVFSPISVGPFVPPGLNLQVVGRWLLPAGQYPERQTLIHYQAVVEPETPVLCNDALTTEHFLYGVGTKGNKHLTLHPSTTNESYDNAIDLANAVNEQTQAFQWGVPSFASIHIGLFVNN